MLRATKHLGAVGIAFGLVLMIAGLARGEALALLQKAARLCLECIGLG